MNRRFYFETGNWLEAGRILHEREPDKFSDVASAQEFLKKSTLAEYGRIPQKEMLSQPPWIYGPICALPVSMMRAGEDFEMHDGLTIRFWLSLKTDDRSETEVFL
ncbi:hypothetical protein [Rugamonas apoptosis]|uniref:Uncharacterized protein n=1 Tax=Rugamonas apoptosis TaxID=2758570 RepID=A0A7W2F7U9_9BURK|nr:hypothetical protein [Rugamonas apoptosis]MBA5686691.1 hypothetical protein [Rugamonas apoptosis]